jgi:hypothetical protein
MLLVVLAAVCGLVALLAHRGDTRCAAVVARADHMTPATAAAQAPALARQVLDRCADSKKIVIVGLLLDGKGRREEGQRVAEGLTRREPGDYLGWRTLSAFTSNPRVAAYARRRARTLNPTVGRQK